MTTIPPTEGELNDAVAAELRAAAARRNVSGAEVARRAGLPPLYVQRRLAGDAKLSVGDLMMISEGIGCHTLDVVAQVLSDRDQLLGRRRPQDAPHAAGFQTTEATMQNRGD